MRTVCLLAACVVAASEPLMELKVPNCRDGTASVAHYYVTTAVGMELPKQHTSAEVCWGDAGWKVAMRANDSYVFSPYDACNAAVWMKSDVMEVFFAPVLTADTAPQYYYEMDTTPSGALFGAVINNTLANDTCKLTHCTAGPLPCTGKATFPAGITSVAANATDGWTVTLSVPWTIFAEEYRPKDGVPHNVWRANFYRYDYPKGPDSGYDDFELQGWSPTHNPSFHIPQRFGVLVPV